MRELTYTFKKRAGTGISDRIPIAPAPETRIVYFEAELAQALGSVIPELGSYTIDQPGRRDGVFVFNRMEGRWPLFDIHLELFHSEQKIRAYLQDLVQIKPSSNAKEQQVLPAAKALAIVIERNLPAGSVIKEIRLGYHGEIFEDAPEQVSAPSWRVLLENGEEVYYVNAISAEVTTEKDNVLVKP
jgi:hypothetical protein